MDKFELRRKALRKLVDGLGYGGISQVATKIGKEPNYVSRMLYTEDKPGRKRIGEDSVELLDKAFPGWMTGDTKTQQPSQDKGDVKKSRSLLDLKSPPSFSLLPVVNFQGLDMSQHVDVAQGEDQALISTPGQFSEWAKITKMPDDSMAPEIYPGEYIAFDPKVQADAGDTVLIEDLHGGLWIRKYRPLPGGRFDAVAANDDHAPLHSTQDGLKVLAVLVGHWRGRRPRRH